MRKVVSTSEKYWDGEFSENQIRHKPSACGQELLIRHILSSIPDETAVAGCLIGRQRSHLQNQAEKLIPFAPNS
jgi:hypothetical protein